VKFPVSKTD